MMTSSKTRQASQLERLVSIGLLFIAIFAVYYRTLDNPFVWDDEYIIKQNYFIQDLGNVKHLFDKKYFSQPVEISYRPVATLSYMLEYAAWNQHAGGYHYINLILHFLNSLLVLALAARLTGRHWLATGAALLFALHPVQTEAINLVTFREDLLCLLFSGASLLAYFRYRDTGRAANIILSLISFIMALFSKETAIVFPAIVFAYEFLAADKPSAKTAFVRSALFILPAILYLFVRFGPMRGPSEAVIFHENSKYTTAILMIQAMARYINLLVWPFRQCIEQIFTEHPRLFDPATLSALFLIFAFFCLTIILYSKRRLSAFGAVWFALFLLPVSNIIPIGVIMAERYLYIPSVGFFIAAAFAFDIIFLGEDRPFKSLTSSALVCLIVVLVAISGFLTEDRNRVWDTPISFWQNACDCAPTSAKPAVNLGLAYLEEDRLEEAADTLIIAVRLASRGRFADIRYGTLYRGLSNLGVVYARRGNPDAAIRFFSDAISIKPDAILPHLNLAILLTKTGRFTEAENEFRKVLQIDPVNPHAGMYLAILLQQSGRSGEALEICNRLLGSNPENARATRLKEHLLMEIGKKNGR